MEKIYYNNKIMKKSYFYKLFQRPNLLDISYNKYFLVLKNKLDNSHFLIHNDLELNQLKTDPSLCIYDYIFTNQSDIGKKTFSLCHCLQK